MQRAVMCLCVLSWLLLFSCTTKEKKIVTEEERRWLRVDSLKAMATDGDLITRLNDNIVSLQVRLLNGKDKSYSHGGIIQTINGVKMVTHIDADNPGADTIRYEPIDSFINPKKNLNCGLFRYDLNPAEEKMFINELNNYHAQKIRFDRIFDLDTDSVMYCSEMIFKALKKATDDRIVIQSCLIAKPMVRMVYNYIERKKTMEELAVTQAITIDNLYLMPHCKEIVRYQLKQFPGQ